MLGEGTEATRGLCGSWVGVMSRGWGLGRCWSDWREKSLCGSCGRGKRGLLEGEL